MKSPGIFSTVLLACCFAFFPFRSPASPIRLTEDFDANWLFSRGDSSSTMMPGFNDANWRRLNLPHDWSIEGPLNAEYGSGNGFVPGGVGWYRKHFQLDTVLKNKLVAIEFDGVYDHSEVWINGQFVGQRPYGYIGFEYELTPYLNWHSDNIIAVRVDHSRYADSRFYTGSGIYRNVRLVITEPLHIAHWGTSVTTPEIKKESALIRVETRIENTVANGEHFSLRSDIVGPDGTIVATATSSDSAAGNSVQTLVQTITIPQPQLWSLQSPQLYTVRSHIKSGDRMVDEIETPFGVRTATFDANKGFALNGVSTKLKGVCIHHDAGPLGAAVPEKVLERRLRLLKEIGVNAIRTSHNPPDPELLDLCDRVGFVVMDEAFDEFTPGKHKWMVQWSFGTASHYGYCESFDQWSVTDISDMVRRDRNHPSIILWSIGNEIDGRNDPFSDPSLGKDYLPANPPAKNMVKCAAPLVAAVKSLDQTRPITAALATVSMSNAVGFPDLFDVVGYNYQEWRYADDHKQFPNRVIYGSENGHQYDAWRAVETNTYIAGQFLWTGIDYLGEANAWPSRANGSGLLDLCGFKKPIGWFRQSLWSDKPMVYLCIPQAPGDRRSTAGEHWNMPTNAMVNVACYANCPEVTLTLNGKSSAPRKVRKLLTAF